MEKILNNWWPMPLFLHTYFKGVGTVLHNMEVEKVKIETYDISVGGLLVVLSARCGLEAWFIGAVLL
jgi:hypothetical protein